MPLSTNVLFQVAAYLSNTSADLAVPAANFSFASQFALDSGTGENAADRLYAATETLAASANADVDLAGSLTDALGAALSFARVKALFLRTASGNVNNVIIGGAASNQFVGPFGAATHTFAVKPGGFMGWIAPDADGWPVTAGTGDLLRFANSGAGSTVTYDVVIIGASA
jgi:hypothetical protein